jgi:hypothetical protein
MSMSYQWVINDGEILIDAATLINIIHDEKPPTLLIC